MIAHPPMSRAFERLAQSGRTLAELRRSQASCIIAILLLSSCASVPPPPRYDPACFEHTFPVGVPYPSPREPLNALFPRPRVRAFPGNGEEPSLVVTVRRVGSYSEPEAQLSLIESGSGEIRAELFVPEPCSVTDQLHSLFMQDPQSTETERLGKVVVRKVILTERQFPGLRKILRNFQRLKLPTQLFEGLVLDQRAYSLWVETPMETLEEVTILPDRAFASWAERAITEVADRSRGSVTVSPAAP